MPRRFAFVPESRAQIRVEATGNDWGMRRAQHPRRAGFAVRGDSLCPNCALTADSDGATPKTMTVTGHSFAHLREGFQGSRTMMRLS